MDEQKTLTDLLDRASRAYYVENSPIMGDTEFDLKLKELQRMEKESGITYPNSPTLRVGQDTQAEFGKMNHIEPMLTIENTYDDDGLREWLNAMHTKYGAEMFEISTKFDGVSLEVVYKEKSLYGASTRGDKTVGDDVTANAKTIRSIPLTVSGIPGSYTLCVRGEVMMQRSVLKSLNERLVSEGKEPKANCRNAASGSLKQLDPNITAQRNLIFRPWDVLVYDESMVPRSYSEINSGLFDNLGFYTEPYARIVTVPYSEVVAAVTEFKERLDSAHPDFDYDGVVIKVADQELRRKIGTDGHRAIKWGIARKWNEDRMGMTILESVTWQVGRTGAVTPVAGFKPFPLDGVTVYNATLHNVEFIEKNDLLLNAPVRVARSGGVIPYVLGRVSAEEFTDKTGIRVDESNFRRITILDRCPECGEPLEFKGDILKCVNPGCPAQLQGRIENWCSKEVMNLDGIGPEIIRDLIAKEIILSPLDLYYMESNFGLTELKDMLGAGYGMTSVKNILSSVNESKKRPFECIIAGMSINGIGRENARLLARHFGTMKNLMSATQAELTAIPGIGDVLATNIRRFMEENGLEWLEIMEETGLKTSYEEAPADEAKEQVLAGLHIVFSGKSDRFPGDTIEEFLESYGAKCGHTVNSKVDFLVTGDKPGPAKVSKAKELGIEIISEDGFFGKFGLSEEQ